MNKPFVANYWGRLRQFEIPYAIVREQQLFVTPSALAVLLVLFESGKAQQRTSNREIGADIQVKITQNTIGERTGLSKNAIPTAITELENQGFIRAVRTRKKRGEFGSNVYTLLNPATRQSLKDHGGTNILFKNEVQYVKLPTCIVREHEAEWSIAKMSSSELRMYISICWLANRKIKKDANELQITLAELRTLAAFSTIGTAKKALEGVSERALLSVAGDNIVLHDPYTGEPLHVQGEDDYSDPANYWTSKGQERATRLNLNGGDPEQVERLLKNCGAEPIPQNDGELKILCPFHADQNPSCSVNPKKRVFFCFGCREKGTLTQLVMQLRGISKGEAIKVMAESAGQDVEFHEPDKRAEAIYSYHDLKGKLKKQVLRYADKEFSQRRPSANGGWIWDVDGVPVLLYNLPRLKHARVVCICEGEKDCDTVMRLVLHDTGRGEVVATTSGNAESWADELADDLLGKKVVIMPDADEAGERYGAEIEASLKSRGIEYRIIGFNDAGSKDVSDFIASGGSKDDLVQRIGRDWVMADVASSVDPYDEHNPDAPIPVI